MTITLSFPQLLKFQTRVVDEKIQSNNDRTQPSADIPREQLIHFKSKGPQVWKVYSRRGKKGNGG